MPLIEITYFTDIGGLPRPCGADGMVRAFHKVCLLRGQRLCGTATGTTPKLVRPYHQCTYHLDARLLYARDRQPEFYPAAHGLKKVHCVDLGGMVFVCVAQVPPPIADLAKSLPGYLAPLGLKHAKVAHRSTTTEKRNWKLVVENNCECYHCGGSHPSLCRIFLDNPKFAARSGAQEARSEIHADWTRCEGAGLPSRFVHDPAMQWRLARVLC